MRTAFINALIALAEKDENIFLISGDLGFSVVEGFVEKFPDRFINVGIAEQNMIGMAAGLALSGKTVFVYSIVSFATFRCFEQIRNDVCYHQANVKIVSVGSGFSYGTQGYTHYGIEDLAVMRALPNLTVYSPADPVETQMIVEQMGKTHGPVYLRLGKAKETIIHADINKVATHLPPAMIPIMESQSGKVILTTGVISATVCQQVVNEKIDCSIYSVPTIKPLDLKSLATIASTAKQIITVEEHQISGGFGSAILEGLEYLVSSGQLAAMPKIKRLGLNDMIPDYVGSQDYLRQHIDLAQLKM